MNGECAVPYDLLMEYKQIYRWAAEVMKHVVFEMDAGTLGSNKTKPSGRASYTHTYDEAKQLLADVYEQLV